MYISTAQVYANQEPCNVLKMFPFFSVITTSDTHLKFLEQVQISIWKSENKQSPSLLSCYKKSLKIYFKRLIKCYHVNTNDETEKTNGRSENLNDKYFDKKN